MAPEERGERLRSLKPAPGFLSELWRTVHLCVGPSSKHKKRGAARVPSVPSGWVGRTSAQGANRAELAHLSWDELRAAVLCENRSPQGQTETEAEAGTGAEPGTETETETETGAGAEAETGTGAETETETETESEAEAEAGAETKTEAGAETKTEAGAET